MAACGTPGPVFEDGNGPQRACDRRQPRRCRRQECTSSCRQVAADVGGLMASHGLQAPVAIGEMYPLRRRPARGSRNSRPCNGPVGVHFSS